LFSHSLTFNEETVVASSPAEAITLPTVARQASTHAVSLVPRQSPAITGHKKLSL
jgi:hypothetical protein